MVLSSWVKSPVYALYSRRLLSQVRRGRVPQHVAVILDGNRRFAREHDLDSSLAAHRIGAEKLDELLEWCDELSIPVVTVWALSMDNLKRDPEELSQLVDVISGKLRSFTNPGPKRWAPRSIHAMGRLEALPESMRVTIADAQARTADNGAMRLNIALGYDGREEITQAVRSLLLDRADQEVSLRDVANQLTSDEIASWLYSKEDPDPDLIIRTSGELRLSGFMLWQSAYSELYFCDALWPAFRKVDFLRALRSYQQRERRFGR